MTSFAYRYLQFDPFSPYTSLVSSSPLNHHHETSETSPSPAKSPSSFRRPLPCPAKRAPRLMASRKIIGTTKVGVAKMLRAASIPKRKLLRTMMRTCTLPTFLSIQAHDYRHIGLIPGLLDLQKRKGVALAVAYLYIYHDFDVVRIYTYPSGPLDLDNHFFNP